MRAATAAVGATEVRDGVLRSFVGLQPRAPGDAHAFGLALTGTATETAWCDLRTIRDLAVPGLLGPVAELSRRFPPSGPVRENGAQLEETFEPVLIRQTRAVAVQCPLRRVVRPEPRSMPAPQTLAYQAELHAY